MKKAKSGIRGVFERVVGSGIWWIRFLDESGKIRRKRIGGRSAAREAVEAARTEVRKGEFIPHKFKRRVLFREIAKDALDYSDRNKRSARDDHNRMKKLLGWFGDSLADSITPEQVEECFGAEKWSPATWNRYRALLSLTYRLAMRSRKVKQNLARLTWHRTENNERIRFLSRDEEVRLRAVIAEVFPQHLPEFDLALHTGLRQSEQYTACWSEVDFERRVITVPLDKGGRTSHARLNAPAIHALVELRKRTGQSGFVCGGVRSPRKWFEQAVETAGILDFTWHCLRHTFASRLVMSGTDLRTVAELLRDKTLAMVMRYAHLAPDHQSAAVERMGKAFGVSIDTPIDTTSTRNTHVPASVVH